MDNGRVKKNYEDKSVMIDAACKELMTYGVLDTKSKLKNCIRRYVLGQKVAPEDMIFWPTGLVAAALWENGDTGLSDKTSAALAAYFDRWEKKGGPIYYLDDLVAGETLLAAYKKFERNGQAGGIINEKNAAGYKALIDKLAKFALEYPTDKTGSLPYRTQNGGGHIYVDMIGMVCPFLCEYGSFYKKNEFTELAIRQIMNFLKYGMDSESGLPYHGYNAETGIKYGIIGWGRAVGWLLRGMTGCMSTEYGKERIKKSYISLTDSVIKWQRKDGSFSWQLQASAGPADTSAAGMICVSVKRGLELGILQGEVYERALAAGKNAIRSSVKNGKVYDCSGECEGFSQYPQQYGAYPWSLAPALMLED